MKVGIALKEVFKDITINDIPVMYHFGDQKELNKWYIDHSKSQKYPLIWYVISPPEPQGNGKLRVDTQLILFQQSKSEDLNTTRYEKAYLTYLEPLYDEVLKALSSNKFVTLLDSYNGIKYKDEPNYGIEASDNFSTSKTTTATIDIVDAKILRLKMDIIPNCLITQ